MSTAQLICDASLNFYEGVKQEKNGRFRSWEHCYRVFYDASNAEHPDFDTLSVHLAFYLASWGMYRSSSFLLQKDYKTHVPVVKTLMDEKYAPLRNLEVSLFKEHGYQVLLQDLNAYLKDYYDEVRSDVKGTGVQKDVSDVLITKILMGVFGCVPAYDNFFTKSVKNTKWQRVRIAYGPSWN